MVNITDSAMQEINILINKQYGSTITNSYKVLVKNDGRLRRQQMIDRAYDNLMSTLKYINKTNLEDMCNTHPLDDTYNTYYYMLLEKEYLLELG